MLNTIGSTPFLTPEQQAQKDFAAGGSGDDLGRDSFLTLLTTQLTNQNPLDPMDNQEFVAQLAQFSSVEGIKGMQSSLESMAADNALNARQDQMLAGANVVGKVAQVSEFKGGEGYPVTGLINLEAQADSLAIEIRDASTQAVVKTFPISIPGQSGIPAGMNFFTWDGKTSDGGLAPEGTYYMQATVARDGVQVPTKVSAVEKVLGATWNPDAQEVSLELASGNAMTLSSIEAFLDPLIFQGPSFIE